MASKKFYYYVLVMTQEGPMFVTKLDWRTNMAMWEKEKEPYCFGTDVQARDLAQELSVGLTWNGNPAYVVQKTTEQTYQPFMYDKGCFKFLTYGQQADMEREKAEKENE